MEPEADTGRPRRSEIAWEVVAHLRKQLPTYHNPGDIALAAETLLSLIAKAGAWEAKGQ